MKRLVLLSVTVSLLLSCQSETLMRDNNVQDENNVVYTSKIFTADFLADTKVQLTDEFRVRWSDGDCIAVFDGNTKHDIYAGFTEENPFNATFEISRIAEVETYRAVTPSTAYDGFSDGALSVNVPSVQTAVSGGCDPKALVMVSESETETEKGKTVFSFRNVCGLFGFNIEEDGVTSVRIASLGGDKLSGKASVTFDSEGVPVVEPASEGSETVVVNGPFTKGNTYYAAVYSGDCPSGIALTYVFGEEESEKTVTWNVHKTKALPFRSKIRLLKVGAALGSMTSSESFKIGTTSLKTDYDANVFAKKSVSAGNLTDGDGNVIVTVPFAAARVVVDKNTGVIDVYDSANDLQPLVVNWHPNDDVSIPEQQTTVTTFYLRGASAGWSESGKNIGFVQSEADPQVLIHSNTSNWRWGGRNQFAIFRSGEIGGKKYNINNSYVFTCPLSDSGTKQEDLVLPLNVWAPIVGGADGNARGSYYNLQSPNYIVLDIRNMKIFTAQK